MSVSSVSICNQALSWLGANPITALTDNTPEGRICDANYENLRDAVLEAREWSFATARAQLNTLAASPSWGPGIAFQLPADQLRVLSVHEDTGQRVRGAWTIEGDALIIEKASVNIRYIRRVEAPKKFSPSFVQALAARIAADSALPLVQSARMQKDMWTLYERKLKDAAALDGMQGTREKIRSDALVRVRR